MNIQILYLHKPLDMIYDNNNINDNGNGNEYNKNKPQIPPIFYNTANNNINLNGNAILRMLWMLF